MSIGTIFGMLMSGLGKSAEVFFVTLIFSLPLGLLICFGRMSKNFIIRNISKFYISVMRGTPLMLQLFVVFFGPYYLFHMKITGGYRTFAILLGFTINYAAYFAEIYRSGIESIPVGQHEAAKLLGYSKQQTFLRIIFPQMVKRVIPPVTNEVITLVKDTSLAFVLSFVEMFTVAKQVAAAEASMTPYIIAGAIYYVINLIIAVLSEKCEKKMGYYK